MTDRPQTPNRHRRLPTLTTATMTATGAFLASAGVSMMQLPAAGLFIAAMITAAVGVAAALAAHRPIPAADTVAGGLPEEMAQIYDRVRDGIVIFDATRNLAFANLSARALILREEDGNPIARLLELFPQISQVSPGREETFRIDDTDASGETRVLQCRVNTVHNHRSTAYYCVLYDATEFQRLTKARADFVSSVNHELRTPLTSLGGALTMLSDKKSQDWDEAEKTLLTMAKRNADRLLVLVNDVLTVQAIDQSGLSINLAPERVAELMQDAMMMNQGYADGHGVELVLDIDDDTGRIAADGTRFQQIMSNLISNAVKYSPRAGTVRIGARVQGDEVTIFVADDGPGILPQFHDRIFDRFAGPLQPKDLQASGTGLGLAITEELTRRQNGTLRFETHTAQTPAEDGGTGTTFLATFPLLIDQAQAPNTEENAA